MNSVDPHHAGLEAEVAAHHICGAAFPKLLKACICDDTKTVALSDNLWRGRGNMLCHSTCSTFIPPVRTVFCSILRFVRYDRRVYLLLDD